MLKTSLLYLKWLNMELVYDFRITTDSTTSRATLSFTAALIHALSHT